MDFCIEQILKRAEQKLSSCSDSPRLDAEILLASLLKKNRSYFMAFPEVVPSKAEQEQFETLLSQRLQGHPIAHIIGTREFWSLDLNVNQHTLIPRPDTEILIEYILHNFAQENLKVADMGTGSGAIALALASEKPNWQISATDRSPEALETARGNATKLGLQNISFSQGNWFEALEANDFDLLISNPPYIPANDPHLTQGDVRFEPDTALISGKDGLDDIRYLIKHAVEYLKQDGWLILKHGYDQKQSVKDLFIAAGYRQITQKDDYAGNPRMTAALTPKLH